MLNTFAYRLQTSRTLRHWFFLAATLFTIFILGYHFGTFDQAIHIPFLKKYADPSLFPGDRFFDLRFQHYSYFWFLFQPFYRLGVLEPVLFAVHVGATYLTYWALWTLSEAIFHDPLTCVLGVLGFVVPHLGFAGFPVFEFSLLNRTFVLPFLLWAIILFLRGRYLSAFALLGVMYNLHVISVNFVLIMFCFDAVVEYRQIGWKNTFGGMAVFILCALPVLIWKANGSGLDFTVRPEWFSIISRGTLYSLFFLITPYPHIWIITLAGLSALGLYVVARRQATPAAHGRTVDVFLWAIIAILAVQAVTAQWYPITLLVQAQIIRAGFFVLIFGYLYFAHYLARRYQSKGASELDLSVLGAAFVVSPLPIVPVGIWIWQRFVGSVWWRFHAAWVAVTLSFVTSLGLAYHYALWSPGIHIYAHRTPWYDVQLWARDHTPTEALFITPPHLWSFYDSEWRVFSERSTVATHSELLEAAFVPDYVDYWRPRFEAVAPGALDHFAGDFFANQETTAEAFYSLADDDLLRVAHTYGAAYLVVEKPHLRPWTVLYANSDFVVYALPMNNS